MSRIEKSQQKIAQFYKVAFHCHSPLSYDWGGNKEISSLNNKDNYLPINKEADFYNLIKGKSGCDVVIITDHMKCSYAARLANHSLKQIGLVVLPGMEISVRTTPVLGDVRVHILVQYCPVISRIITTGYETEKNRFATDFS